MKKRILALALVVLMVVGAVPMAVFAADGDPVDTIENYTGKDWSSDLVADDFDADDFDATSVIKKAYNTNNWVPVTFAKGNDASGETALKWSSSTNLYRNSIIPGDSGQDDAADYESFWARGYAGLDLHLTFEIQGTEGSSSEPMVQLRTSSGAGCALLKFENNELRIRNSVVGKTATTEVLANIPKADSFMRIDILVDAHDTLEAGKSYYALANYYVFVDGVYVATSQWGTTSSGLTADYTNQNTWEAALGEGAEVPARGIMIGGITFENCQGYYFKNVNAYRYDDNGNGDVTDSERKVNVDIPTLYHYQDFDAITETSFAANAELPTLLGGSKVGTLNKGANVIDDGRGGKALTAISNNAAYYQVEPNIKSGTSFAYSMDYKLIGTPANDFLLFNGTAYNANAYDYNGDGALDRDFNTAILYLHSDGGVYLARKEDATSSGVIINTTGGDNKAQKLCDLSRDEYTNIAISVNVAANTYAIYIDGINVTGDLQFLCDTDLAILKATTTFANGFGLSFRRVNLATYLAVDNVAVYAADGMVNENTTPLNGVKKEGDSYIYYINGKKTANTLVNGTSYYAGENGVLVENGNITIGGKLYEIENYVAAVLDGIKGTKLYIDGVLLTNGAGIYNGDTYLADENGNLLTGVYTVNGEEWLFDTEAFKGERFAIDDEIAVDMSTGTKYDTLQEAINGSNEDAIVKLYGDVVYDTEVQLTNSVTLDLNGKTINVSSFVAFSGSKIVDTGATKGLIKVENDNIIAGITTSDAILVYNTVREGYEAAAVKKQDNFEIKEDGDGFVLIFRPSLDNNTAYNEAIFGNGDSKISFEIYISDEDGNRIRTFLFSDSFVKEAYGTGKALKLTVKGASKYAGQNLKVSYALNSDSGMICEMEAGEFKPFTAKISILGDSISTYSGVSVGGRDYYGPDGENQTNDLTDASQTWWGQLIADKGYDLEVNQSRSGSPVCNTGYDGADATSVSFLARMDEIGNPDVIAVFGGTNDAWAKVPIGDYKYSDWTEDDLKSFRPAFAYMLSYLLENHPDAQIVVIINSNLENYDSDGDPETNVPQSMVEICEYYGVTYVQLSTETAPQGAHPDADGMTQIFNEIKDYFN